MRTIKLAALLCLMFCALAWGYTAPACNTIHFVGGVGDKSGKSDDNAGGCTRTAWESSGDPCDFMASDGGPVVHEVECLIANDDGDVQLDQAGEFGDVVVGTLVNFDPCHADDDSLDGIYEITDATLNTITIDLSYVSITSSAYADVIVGGAYATMQAAADDDSTNATNYDRDILTNLDEALGAGDAALDFDMGLGTGTNVKRIIGCDSDFAELANYLYVTYQKDMSADTSGGSACVINISKSASVSIEFRHIEAENTDTGTPGGGENAWGDSGSFYGLTCLYQCKSTGGYHGFVLATNRGVVLVDCVSVEAYYFAAYIGSFHSIIGGYYATRDTSPAAQAVGIYGGSGNNIIGAVANGKRYSVQLAAGYVTTIYGCTLYSADINGIYNSGSSHIDVYVNNIISVDDAANDKAIGSASVWFERYNITNVSVSANTGFNPDTNSEYNEAVAAMLVNPAIGDFRIDTADADAPDHLIDKGLPTYGDGSVANQGKTSIGAHQLTQTQSGGGGGTVGRANKRGNKQ